jgi:acetylornithine deacetylase/succinyl-diaminopimelate desuccinylase-like protein
VTARFVGLALAAVSSLAGAAASVPENNERLAFDIFKQLIEINTTDSVGSVSQASEALRQRLLKAGFESKDVAVVGPSERKKNLVVRLHGTGLKRPVLILGHLDVVEAPRADWTTDPFELVEKDGYFYGRGTQDLKSGDAIAVASLIRLLQEGFKPDRDVILALTAGQESFKDNGTKWLIEQRRDLIDAEFVLNMDGAGVLADHGRPTTVRVDAAEKLYADFRLTVVKPGGTTALPVSDNAIYHLAQGLARLEHYRFPAELNVVTRAYFSRLAESDDGPKSADLRGLLADPSDSTATVRISRDAINDALLHTICAPTRLEAGHANNALPQMASAMVNCRILPGHSAEEIRTTLVDVLSDSQIEVAYVREFDGRVFARAPDEVAMAVAPLRPDVVRPLERVAAALWPAVPVIPGMSIGESDAVWTAAAGMPTYAVSGLAIDRDDIRSHGRDERLPVASFYKGLEFFYQYIRALTTSP